MTSSFLICDFFFFFESELRSFSKALILETPWQQLLAGFKYLQIHISSAAPVRNE